MNHIFVTLSYAPSRKLFVATLKFNLLQKFDSVADSNLSNFCEKLAEALRSTYRQATPMPSRSSASIAHLSPKNVGVAHDQDYPIPGTSLSPIQTVIDQFVNEIIEFDTLFIDVQEEEDGT